MLFDLDNGTVNFEIGVDEGLGVVPIIWSFNYYLSLPELKVECDDHQAAADAEASTEMQRISFVDILRWVLLGFHGGRFMLMEFKKSALVTFLGELLFQYALSCPPDHY